MECNKSIALFIDFIYLENQSEQLLSQKDILPTDSLFLADLQAFAIELPWPGWLGVLRPVILRHLDISRMREAVLSNVCRTQAEKFCSDNSRENVKDRLGI